MLNKVAFTRSLYFNPEQIDAVHTLGMANTLQAIRSGVMQTNALAKRIKSTHPCLPLCPGICVLMGAR